MMGLKGPKGVQVLLSCGGAMGGASLMPPGPQGSEVIVAHTAGQSLQDSPLTKVQLQPCWQYPSVHPWPASLPQVLGFRELVTSAWSQSSASETCHIPWSSPHANPLPFIQGLSRRGLPRPLYPHPSSPLPELSVLHGHFL